MVNELFLAWMQALNDIGSDKVELDAEGNWLPFKMIVRILCHSFYPLVTSP